MPTSFKTPCLILSNYTTLNFSLISKINKLNFVCKISEANKLCSIMFIRLMQVLTVLCTCHSVVSKLRENFVKLDSLLKCTSSEWCLKTIHLLQCYKKIKVLDDPVNTASLLAFNFNYGTSRWHTEAAQGAEQGFGYASQSAETKRPLSSAAIIWNKY